MADTDEQQHEGQPKAPTFDWLPDGMEALADGEYDAIVLGTGLKECVISGLLSKVKNQRVLQIDRNAYYGSEGASLNLTTLFAKFNAGEPPASLGANREYNIDLIPKFIMATGNLTKMLLHTGVTRYLEFKSIAGSFVYKGGKIMKIPATPKEALSSPLMGVFEKNRFRKFLLFVDAYKPDDASTHEGRDLTTLTMRQLYTDFGLLPESQQFISHSMCLQLDETHMDRPALPTVRALQTYCYSMARYGTSPYIYPLYGLGGLPEGFSRICAIHGGTFMLNQDVDEIIFDDAGVAIGVRAGNQMARAKMVIGDPSYFPPDKIQATGAVVRCICLLSHPIPGTTPPAASLAGVMEYAQHRGHHPDALESVQIVVPGAQVGRVNDVFVCAVGPALQVTARGVYVAIVSTRAETANPDDDVAAGVRILGPPEHLLHRFLSVSTTYQPVADGAADHCYISSSFDGTSHFENDVADMLQLYRRVAGEDLDMDINADSVEGEY